MKCVHDLLLGQGRNSFGWSWSMRGSISTDSWLYFIVYDKGKCVTSKPLPWRLAIAQMSKMEGDHVVETKGVGRTILEVEGEGYNNWGFRACWRKKVGECDIYWY